MKKLSCLVLTAAMLFCSAAGLSAPSSAENAVNELVPIKRYGIALDRENEIITGIPGTVTAPELCDMFVDPNNAVSVSYNGSTLMTEPVPTGAVLTNNSESFTVIIYGDVNSDAKVNLSDVAVILKKVAKWDVSPNEFASDVNVDGKTNLSDVAMILQKIAKWRVYLGGSGMIVVEEPQKAKHEDASLKLAFGNSIDRYTPDTEIGDAVTDVMYCAKNEIEFTQFALQSMGGHNDLSVSISDFKNGKGEKLRTELYQQTFVTITDERSDIDVIADVMAPVLTDIDIKAGAICPFGIKVFPDKDASYGLYEATVTVKDADGKEIKTALVYLNVWDFVLPDASNCRTSFGLGHAAIGSSSTATTEERYKNYYDFFIENRMNPVLLPYDVCSEEAKQYLDDPRVNSFLAGGEGYGGTYDVTDEQLAERYALLSQNEEWMKKAYFYFDDEPLPWTKEGVTVAQQAASIKENYERAQRLFPGAKLVIPNHHNEITDDSPEQMPFGEDIVGYCMKYSSILCPHSWMFKDYNKTNENIVYTKEMADRFGSLQDRIAKKLEEDPSAEFWWYTSDNPRDGMCNIYITKSGMECRALFWQQYLYGADGFLYWASNEFHLVNSRNTHMSNIYAGLLCYSNKIYKTDEAVGSVRVEMIRDGIEDFDYLHMIEEQYGKEVADRFVERITTDLLEYSTDSKVLEEVRIEMGELLQGWIY
ncbi:MAG: DUF4091 domain-containing protein [Ruminococcaceae bacterium]|nr:DUF4091 domain-containing protein [Oscillospiraceae bacterium]